jgi:disulfide bond formation protein DsbB
MAQPSPRLLLTVTGLLCGTSVGLALLAQYQFNMQPCPWCVLQRLLFVALAVLCLVGAALPHSTPRRALSALSLPLAIGGMGAALWQHFVAAKSSSCALTLADTIVSGLHLDTLLPGVFEVRASCADAAVNVFGVPFEFWSLALFALTGTVLVLSVLTPTRRA